MKLVDRLMIIIKGLIQAHRFLISQSMPYNMLYVDYRSLFLVGTF